MYGWGKRWRESGGVWGARSRAPTSGSCPPGNQNASTSQYGLRGLFILFFIFLAVLGLRFCARAFSSCGERGHSSLRCAGLSLSRPLLLRSTGSRRAGSVIVTHGPSCSAACGILPDQGSNSCSRIGRQTLNHRATREAQGSL